MPRHAFTLIELLVVIAIILLLVGLTIGVVNALGRSVEKSRTRSIMQIVQTGLSLHRTEAGGMPAPAEHPLAGSATPRLAWVRDPASALAAPAAVGEALLAGDPAWLEAADQPRLLADDDRFADVRSHFLFGMARRELRILGLGLRGVTAFSRIRRPESPPLPAPAEGNLAYVERVRPLGDEVGVDKMLAYVLGKGSTWTDLNALGALRSSPSATSAAADWSGGAGDFKGRVFRDPERFFPDRAGVLAVRRPGPVLQAEGGWRGYLLRGPAVYDAWGRELLFSTGSSGDLHLASAGPDGCLRWDPGADGTYQTGAADAAPAGDDRDGAADNLVTSVRETR